MNIHEWPEESQYDDSLRKWIPVVVPLSAVVLSALIFLVAWEVLSRY